jgi:transposase
MEGWRPRDLGQRAVLRWGLDSQRARTVTASRPRFGPEFKNELCVAVTSTSKRVREVAQAWGMGPETLRNWLVKYRATSGGTGTKLMPPERAPLEELEQETRDLRAETVFLKKVSA